MSQYQLIAFDMDGTLLNSQKQLSPKTVERIRQAADAGKTVILSTGRGPAELEGFYDKIPGLRYINCISGAYVYDLLEKKCIFSQPLEPEVVLRAMEIAGKEDVMFHFLELRSVVQKSCLDQMEHYQMGIYETMFRQVSTTFENLEEEYRKSPFPVGKLNLYHTSTESRARTEQRILDAGLPVTMAYSEIASLELSALGVSKGLGLAKLCTHLGIPLEQTIAVGDAENDLEALKTAGLGIAMGNAKEVVKQNADVVVADCDHDGCAEAIEKYLLK